MQRLGHQETWSPSPRARAAEPLGVPGLDPLVASAQPRTPDGQRGKDMSKYAALLGSVRDRVRTRLQARQDHRAWIAGAGAALAGLA